MGGAESSSPLIGPYGKEYPTNEGGAEKVGQHVLQVTTSVYACCVSLYFVKGGS